jgi:hypothetical protein
MKIYTQDIKGEDTIPIKHDYLSNKKRKKKKLRHTSNMVGTTLNTVEERMKFIARLPRSIIRFNAPVSRLVKK